MVVNLKWYASLGYVFLLLVITLQVLSLTILCMCSRRLSGFRHTQLKIIFIFSSVQFSLRLVYDICFYSPLSEYNILCWILRSFIEVATCCMWLRIVILAGYYYSILHMKKDADSKTILCVCAAAWAVPIFPVIFHGITFSSSQFYANDSCWRGPTNEMLNITDAVDHLCLIAATLAYLVGCYYHFWYKSSESLLNQLHHLVPNLKGKANLVVLYIVIAVACEATVEVRHFWKGSHDLVDVGAWCLNGLMTSLCFCFLDIDIQRAFLARGNHILGINEEEGSEINLTQADCLSSPPLSPSSALGDISMTQSTHQSNFSCAGTLVLRPWDTDAQQHNKDNAMISNNM